MKVAEISSRVAIVTLPSTRAVGQFGSFASEVAQSLKWRVCSANGPSPDALARRPVPSWFRSDAQDDSLGESERSNHSLFFSILCVSFVLKTTKKQPSGNPLTLPSDHFLHACVAQQT